MKETTTTNIDSKNKPLDEKIIKRLREPLFDSSMSYYFLKARGEGREIKPEFEEMNYREMMETDEFLKAYDQYAAELYKENMPEEKMNVLLSEFAIGLLYKKKNIPAQSDDQLSPERQEILKKFDKKSRARAFEDVDNSVKVIAKVSQLLKEIASVNKFPERDKNNLLKKVNEYLRLDYKQLESAVIMLTEVLDNHTESIMRSIETIKKND